MRWKTMLHITAALFLLLLVIVIMSAMFGVIEFDLPNVFSAFEGLFSILG